MAISNKTFDYSKRNFADAKAELLKFIKQYYPDVLKDYDDSTIGSMLLDLNAASVDILSYNTDRAFQETQLGHAQERKSLLEHAKTMGLSIPNKRPSVVPVEFTVTVPTKGSGFDTEYLPIIKAGSQVTGGGKVFELLDDIDFSNPFSQFGVPNRTSVPLVDANQRVVSYNITKTEVVYQGVTKVFRKTIRTQDIKPFLEITLPENDVISVEQIIAVDGVVTTVPSLDNFFDEDIRFYEVNSLAQQHVFIDDTLQSAEDNFKVGKRKLVTKKFIKEFTDRGFCKVRFGSGDADLNLFYDYFTDAGALTGLESYLNNTALGELPKPNTTLFIRYRVGGGANTNVGSGVITSLGNVNVVVNGIRDDFNRRVRTSLKVNNPIPALGGVDRLSNEQIRNLISYNYSSQERCVTLRDYLTRVYMMPGRYGTPFQVTALKENNKVVIPIIGLDEEGKLNNSSTSTLKTNISEYLVDYRMINDYVEIRDGRVFNLGYDFTLLIDDNINKFDVITNVVKAVSDYHDVSTKQMGEDLFLGQLMESINNVIGVLNVNEYKIYNKVGGLYSNNEIGMAYTNEDTREISVTNLVLYGEKDAMFEIKYPEKDIRITLKRRNEI